MGGDFGLPIVGHFDASHRLSNDPLHALSSHLDIMHCFTYALDIFIGLGGLRLIRVQGMALENNRASSFNQVRNL